MRADQREIRRPCDHAQVLGVTHVIIATEISSTCPFLNSNMARGRPPGSGNAKRAAKAKSNDDYQNMTMKQFQMLKSYGTFVSKFVSHGFQL